MLNDLRAAMRRVTPLAMLLALLPAAAREETTIEIKALRNPEWAHYRAFLAGMDEFERNRSKYAPTARLWFSIYPIAPDAQLKDAVLRLETDAIRIPVPLDAHGNFTLPRSRAAWDGNAELVLGSRQGTFGWQVHVRSAGSTDRLRRFGDYRLECRVRWAVVKASQPERGLEKFGPDGPCNGSGNYFYSSRPVAGIEIVRDDLQVRLGNSAIMPDGQRYQLPLGFSAFGNQMQVKLTFRDDAR